jgi:hypothetical protein
MTEMDQGKPSADYPYHWGRRDVGDSSERGGDRRPDEPTELERVRERDETDAESHPTVH